MFKNYLTIALRHFARNKAYTFINVIGLALGVCGCLLIFLITSYHLSFDNFHPDMGNVYCVDINSPGAQDQDHAHWNAVPAPMPAAMRQEIPGFETVAAFHHYQAKVSIPVAGSTPKKIEAYSPFIIAEPQYFNILQYHWLAGSIATSLSKPNTVVLTESRAHLYFGNLPADKMIGKTVIYDDSLLVSVTGILEDWNGNSDFNFSDFISHATINHSFLKNDIELDNWNKLNHGSRVLVKLGKGVKPQQVDALFIAFVKKHLDPDPGSTLRAELKPFSGIHFHQEYGGEGEKANWPALYILSGVAIFILLIAAFNFINLSTAQAIQRTKEIGIRKVLGSSKGNLMLQFLTETFLLSLAAVIIAALCITPVLHAFSNYISEGVNFSITDLHSWGFLLCISIAVTLLAGFYPAKVLARFVPVISLKGAERSTGNDKGYLRKGLIVFQFTVSIIFIICTIVVGKQVSYMASKELGLKTDAIITLRPMWNDPGGKMKVLAQKITGLPGADKVLLQAFAPIGFAHMTNSIQLKGADKGQFIEASQHTSNEDFVPFYGMKILTGRNLLHTDSMQEFLINQTCAQALGFKDYHQAIGKLLMMGQGAYPIVGVVADFNENTFREKIPPVIITHDPTLENCIAIKTSLLGKNAGDVQRLLTEVEKQWKIVYPEETFDYSFLDDSIKRLYEGEMRLQWLVNTATLIAIFISCMGLFGLAMFTAERRTKEIGIRKVLGASVTNIVMMLSSEMSKLIVLALLIASPLAGFLTEKWLQSFAYHTKMDVWVFVFAGAGALIIAFATIGFKAIKAGMTNPVESLRSE